MRQKIRVRIYERVKYGTKWGRKRIAIPPLKKDGTLFLKDDRQGIFQLCWHENRQKQWQNVKGRVSENELPFLSDAITQADDKSWFLNNRDRRVNDPTTDVVERKKFSVEVPRYIEAKSGCKKTVSAHEHAVTEFVNVGKQAEEGKGTGLSLTRLARPYFAGTLNSWSTVKRTMMGRPTILSPRQ